MKKQSIKIPKIKSRVIWEFNPSTKTVPSKRIYNRKHKFFNNLFE
ncbi:hypothetical protein [Aliarcobacter cryaerophilus]|mgnify:CR=1 FL=1|jgi:hypothetical protein|nr:hypothetical protein [Aliarcobacter cryaerophilus]MCT7518889.1 hypothetical protein [Aliarcobacter cryaerophilus]